MHVLASKARSAVDLVDHTACNPPITWVSSTNTTNGIPINIHTTLVKLTFILRHQYREFLSNLMQLTSYKISLFQSKWIGNHRSQRKRSLLLVASKRCFSRFTLKLHLKTSLIDRTTIWLIWFYLNVSHFVNTYLKQLTSLE